MNENVIDYLGVQQFFREITQCLAPIDYGLGVGFFSISLTSWARSLLIKISSLTVLAALLGAPRDAAAAETAAAATSKAPVDSCMAIAALLRRSNSRGDFLRNPNVGLPLIGDDNDVDSDGISLCGGVPKGGMPGGLTNG